MSRVTCPQCRFTVLDAGGPGTSIGACPRCLARGRGAVPMVELTRTAAHRRNGRYGRTASEGISRTRRPSAASGRSR